MILEIKSYVDDRGIEIQQASDIEGKEPDKYTAHVTVGISTPDGQQAGHPISVRVMAANITEAFKKADPALKAEIKKFENELKEESTKPSIILP
jgi:hypothetical protein